jgi:hypothetical protein
LVPLASRSPLPTIAAVNPPATEVTVAEVPEVARSVKESCGLSWLA